MVRAEAKHDDRQAAVDLAVDKLLERLRRAHDKRNVRRGRRRISVADATADLTEPLRPQTEEVEEAKAEEAPDHFGTVGDSPIEVREKVHASHPMTLAEAVRRMELVGHDFFLFHDAEHDRPSVVYRRRGWSYGVIHLDVTDGVAGVGTDTHETREVDAGARV